MARPRKSAAAPPKSKPTPTERVDAVADPLPNQPLPNDSKPTRGPGRPSNADKLREQLAQTIAMVGFGVGALVNPADGRVIASNASDLAEQLVMLAERNPKFRRLLEGSLNGSAYAGVLIVLTKITVEIAANHGRPVPAILFGARVKDDAPTAGDSATENAQRNGAQ